MLRPVRSWDTADGAKCGDQDLDPTGAARLSPGGQFRKTGDSRPVESEERVPMAPPGQIAAALKTVKLVPANTDKLIPV